MTDMMKRPQPLQQYTIHPISAHVHWGVSNAASNMLPDPASILDIGGTGKMGAFLDCPITDANIKDGIDGAALPFADKSYDICVSVAVIEHVEHWRGFFSESLRVAKFGAVHWFPFGPAAARVEVLKKDLGHEHPCQILSRKDIEKTLQPLSPGYSIFPFVSIAEHLLLLATLNPRVNVPETYKAVRQYGDEPYGFLVITPAKGGLS